MIPSYKDICIRHVQQHIRVGKPRNKSKGMSNENQNSGYLQQEEKGICSEASKSVRYSVLKLAQVCSSFFSYYSLK